MLLGLGWRVVSYVPMLAWTYGADIIIKRVIELKDVRGASL
jgi:hypothetical protein